MPALAPRSRGYRGSTATLTSIHGGKMNRNLCADRARRPAARHVLYLALLTAFFFRVGGVMKILRLRTYHVWASISSERGQDRMRHALLRAHRRRRVMPVGAAHMCVGFAGPRPSGNSTWSPTRVSPCWRRRQDIGLSRRPGFASSPSPACADPRVWICLRPPSCC
jgi:hypothetical protein